MKVNELKAEIVRNEMFLEEFADSVGIDRTTFWRRLNNPNNFTLGEILKMIKTLDISTQRAAEIFFADVVS